ncbi:MAG: hypothetical protein LP071_01635 [Candidatus Nanogingivalaceae bacterium]|nr:hypothetical protein [Candidatus Nanogingivalaceae bacterium]
MRYLVLVLLNVPIILAALINIVTQYKLRKVSPARFRHQLIIWLILMIVLIGSFPLYNISIGHPPLDSSELSLFDILQTTAIILLFYIVNNQRQRIDQNERRLRDLHQELSIKLSNEKYY